MFVQKTPNSQGGAMLTGNFACGMISAVRRLPRRLFSTRTTVCAGTYSWNVSTGVWATAWETGH